MGVKARQVTLDEIIGSVCAACGVQREDLIAAGRGRQAAEARSMVALVVQEERGITITEAARVFRRDTSSLTAGAARLRAKLDGDEVLRHRLAEVKAGLRIPQ
ncbi:MAG: hypothetical protein MUE60_15340 [Candidatus Eisenbacteria bacterium]|nr:hypothetical protein [Candidatus Eisenbacteria bacterium]